MKGKIVIEANEGLSVNVLVKMTPLHKMEKLVLIDALCESLQLADAEERTIIGLTIAAGGLSAVAGTPAQQFAIDVTALKKELKKDKDEATEA